LEIKRTWFMVSRAKPTRVIAYLMSDQDGGLVAEHGLDTMLEDVLSSVVVNSGKGVVKEDKVAAKVGAAGQVQPLTLSTGEIDAAQTSLGLIASRQDLEVKLESTCMDDLVVVSAIKGLSEDNVVLEG
jgi:hypothetical protein